MNWISVRAPWWKRLLSVRYRRCNHMWEKVSEWTEDYELHYETYCAKCDTTMLLTKSSVKRLQRLAEIHEEYGTEGAHRHFFMFETEGDVVEKKETPEWRKAFYSAIEPRMSVHYGGNERGDVDDRQHYHAIHGSRR